MSRKTYEAQVNLLVGVLPYVAKETMFALKGGTAINLFYRDLPRLSADIDLTYLPITDRANSLAEINAGLTRLAEDISANAPATQANRIAGGGGVETRVMVRRSNIEVKIETSPVARGVVNDPELRGVSEAVEDRFGFAEIQVVAFEDLFAGKLHAALDRQHPRDLYDVKLLYENEGISDALFRTFLIYIASSVRPVHELLAPNLIDLDRSYAREFDGMTSHTVSIEELAQTRARLIGDIQSRLDDRAKEFLLGLHDCTPRFDAIGHASAAELPAIGWKLLNLEKLKSKNPAKHAKQRDFMLALFNR